MFSCILDMISSVEEEVDILRDWFGVTFTEIKVPCTHCIRENKVPTLLSCLPFFFFFFSPFFAPPRRLANPLSLSTLLEGRIFIHPR